MTSTDKKCRNCEYNVTQYHNYCPNCGQKIDDKLSMRVLFHNTVMNYFSVDARFFRSFIPLLIKPGYLAKEFVKGKRLTFLHPAQFYLFTSIIFFFLFSIVTRSSQRSFDDSMKQTIGNEKEIVTEADKIRDSLMLVLEKQQATMNTEDSLAVAKVKNILQKEIPVKDSVQTVSSKSNRRGRIFGFNFDPSLLDSLEQTNATTDEKLKAMGYTDEHGMFARYMGKQVIKFRKNKGVGLLKAFFDTIPISMFFLIPIFAILLKIVYIRKRKGRFAHHMVFSFYYFAFIFLILSLLLTANLMIDVHGIIIFLLIMYMFIYLYLSMKRFYDQGYIKTFFKTSFVSFIYLSFVIPLTFVLLWVVSFFLY